MTTMVLGPPPPELAGLLERRRALGQDRFDEVWEGVYHMAPAPSSWHGYAIARVVVVLDSPAAAAGLTPTDAFNLGGPDDYRVPDIGYHRSFPSGVYVPTAAVVVEVVSPDDQTFAKFGFYAAHGVDEILIVDPGQRRVCWYRRVGDSYEERETSDHLGVSGEDIGHALRWPDGPGSD